MSHTSFTGSFWLRTAIISFVAVCIVMLMAWKSGRTVIFESLRQLSGESRVTVIMGGDVMFDRNIRKLGEEVGYATLMAQLAPVFERADIAVANLEGPVTTNPSKTLLPDGSYGKVLHFTFAPESLEALKVASIDLVSLANNHTDNFYASGLIETKQWLAKEGIDWFGDPWNRILASTTKIIEVNGIEIAFVGYHAFQQGLEDILGEIRSQKLAGRFVIAMPHWGEEYVTSQSLALRGQAIRFIEAGAGAVIGAHPHVIMEHEWIESVPVYYSLGNLLFDQYFSEETTTGLIVELEIVRKDDQIYVDDVVTRKVRNSSQNGASLL